MSGAGSNSRRQKRRWFLRGRRGTELTGAEGRILLFFQNYPQVDGVARRKSGDCFAAQHLPPILAAWIRPSPGQRERLSLPRLNFFTDSLYKGGEIIYGQILKDGPVSRLEKVFPEILPVLPFSKGGELLGNSTEGSSLSPFGKGG
jgi:hypothetical protein